MVREKNLAAQARARRLKALEEENRRLKKLLVDSMLDASTLKEMLEKMLTPSLRKYPRERLATRCRPRPTRSASRAPGKPQRRRHAGAGECDRRCALRDRRAPHRHAGEAGARVAGDQGRVGDAIPARPRKSDGSAAAILPAPGRIDCADGNNRPRRVISAVKAANFSIRFYLSDIQRDSFTLR
jgi:hypothetical protein